MRIQQWDIEMTEGGSVPGILLEPENPLGAAVLLHGYGGSKEEVLGLAWRAAKAGVAVLSIDLAGHGEHPKPLSGNILGDVEDVIRACRRFGKVAVIGFSLGGRLALLSAADYVIAISPALGAAFGDEMRDGLKEYRQYRVRQHAPSEEFFDVLTELPQALPLWDRKTLVLYAEREDPDIAAQCAAISGCAVRRISQALHRDVFLHEEVFGEVRQQLEEWFKRN